jgi:iron-sulfur cluster assembly protein
MEIRIADEILPLQITEKAIRQIEAIMAAKNITTDNYGLRIGMKGGGCSATFLLGFDKATPTDKMYMCQSIPVYIEKKHLMYVFGLELDYEEGENGTGFTFTKPEN